MTLAMAQIVSHKWHWKVEQYLETHWIIVSFRASKKKKGLKKQKWNYFRIHVCIKSDIGQGLDIDYPRKQKRQPGA